MLWLEQYCDLSSLDVSSQEIWELRNSLLHMTNLESHKVRKGSSYRLVPSIVSPDIDVPPRRENEKYLHVARFLMRVLPTGVQKWLETYDNEREKIYTFVERYDTIVSDVRLVRGALHQ